jgi:asparagine synthase (glutamine-hydrolysing)
MFALAIWDRHARRLYLVRDRIGEKPLYYGWIGEAFVFGSELKSLRVYPGFDCDINRDAIALLLRHSYIPAPHSVYIGIHKLPPGSVLELDMNQRRPEPRVAAYWSLRAAVEAGRQVPFDGSAPEALDELEACLARAVRQQMVSDVPLGAFLSGGIDSTTIVALMQSQSSRPVKTFAIGFQEAGYDEAPYARAVARHLGTDHTELYVTSQEARDVIPCLATLWDEPFADSSQVPTYLVAALARRHVTVSLSGDGGDELFAGYPRYFATVDRDNRYRRVPRLAQAALAATPAAAFDGADRVLAGLGIRRGRSLVRRLHNFSRTLPYEPSAYYRHWAMSHWQQPQRVVIGARDVPTLLTTPSEWVSGRGLIDHLTYLDLRFYLPEDILVKVDRAGMAVSLESRMPFLDHRVVEFSQRLPIGLKVRQGQGKWLLRQLLHKYVPAELVERPKMGFGIPVNAWLRGPLRDWAEALLEPTRLRHEGIFDVASVRHVWEQHCTGREDWQYHLWDVLVFQQWYRTASGT